MEFKLYDNVVFPVRHRNRKNTGTSKYNFGSMAVGQGFKVKFTGDVETDNKIAKRMRTAVASFQTRGEGRARLSTRIVNEEESKNDPEPGAGLWIRREKDLTSAELEALIGSRQMKAAARQAKAVQKARAVQTNAVQA